MAVGWGQSSVDLARWRHPCGTNENQETPQTRGVTESGTDATEASPIRRLAPYANLQKARGALLPLAMQRAVEAGSQSGRQIDRQTDRQKDRHPDTQTLRQTQTEIEEGGD